MTITMAVVRSALDSEEPNYESAKSLGFEALPLLEELAASKDILLASKAVYLAGLINGELSSTILERAAIHENPILRATAASIVGQLNSKISNRLLLTLLNDSELSVQNTALKFLPPNLSSELTQSIERIAHEHTEPTIKKMAADALKHRSQARNMGGSVKLDARARGMGRLSNVTVKELGMGIANKSGGMGRLRSDEPAFTKGLKSQSATMPSGMGAAVERGLTENAGASAFFWENAALAWEKSASAHDGGITRKIGKRGCGCGSNPR